MGRSLALACVLCGCGFSTTVESTGNPVADGPDSITGDAAVDAPPDATEGSEAVMAMTTNFPSVADVYLRTSVAPDENTNDRDYFIVDGDLVTAGLVRFDLSAIPASGIVEAAELRLYDDGDAGQQVSVYQLLESWDEATATSNQRATGMAWLGAGATPPSRGTSAIATFTPANANQTYAAALPTATVQGWVTAPATNFGIAIATTNSDGSRFASRERSTASQRPVLRVTYRP